MRRLFCRISLALVLTVPAWAQHGGHIGAGRSGFGAGRSAGFSGSSSIPLIRSEGCGPASLTTSVLHVPVLGAAHSCTMVFITDFAPTESATTATVIGVV